MSENAKDHEIEIQNVVASASVDQKFNLLDIVKNFRNVEYRPKTFPGLVFRLKRPKTATLIFSSGKMVCTGAKSEKLARSAVNKVVRELKKNGIIVLGKPNTHLLELAMDEMRFRNLVESTPAPDEYAQQAT